MLELSKRVLEVVSVDASLFANELKKYVQWLNATELQTLKIWCLENFGKKYPALINDVFAQSV
jgi:hypothetical protein